MPAPPAALPECGLNDRGYVATGTGAAPANQPLAALDAAWTMFRNEYLKNEALIGGFVRAPCPSNCPVKNGDPPPYSLPPPQPIYHDPRFSVRFDPGAPAKPAVAAILAVPAIPARPGHPGVAGRPALPAQPAAPARDPQWEVVIGIAVNVQFTCTSAG